MFEDWDEALEPQAHEKLLKKLAWEVKKRKLEAPAVLFIESHKSLSFLGGQATIAFAPFLVPFFGIDNVRDYAKVLNRRDSAERLLSLIEGPAENLMNDTTGEVAV